MENKHYVPEEKHTAPIKSRIAKVDLEKVLEGIADFAYGDEEEVFSMSEEELDKEMDFDPAFFEDIWTKIRTKCPIRDDI